MSELLDNKTLIARLRYQGRQYSNGQASRGGGQSVHMLTQAANLIELLESEKEQLEVELKQIRAEVREWLCADCNTVYPGPPQSGFSCVICPKCGGHTGSRLNIEKSLLERRVAMLVDALKIALPHFKPGVHQGDCAPSQAVEANIEEAIESSQATADAFIRKVEARALEEAANAVQAAIDKDPKNLAADYARISITALRRMAAEKLKG